MNPPPTGNLHGFTLLEVVITLSLVVFLLIAVPVYFRPVDTDLAAHTHILKTHIRYAQSRAMNTDRAWGIRFNVAQRAYWLFKDGEDETKIPLPGQAADNVHLGEMDLDITGNTFNLTFDGWGRPDIEGRSFSEGQITLNLNRSGLDGDTIIINENTGFIP